jgi:hypothetical protein
MMPPASSTKTGIVQPHSSIEAASWATCSSLCVRALGHPFLDWFHRTAISDRAKNFSPVFSGHTKGMPPTMRCTTTLYEQPYPRGRGQTILIERERIKRQTIANRRTVGKPHNITNQRSQRPSYLSHRLSQKL